MPSCIRAPLHIFAPPAPSAEQNEAPVSKGLDLFRNNRSRLGPRLGWRRNLKNQGRSIKRPPQRELMHSISGKTVFRIASAISKLISSRLTAICPHAGSLIATPTAATYVASSKGWTAKTMYSGVPDSKLPYQFTINRFGLALKRPNSEVRRQTCEAPDLPTPSAVGTKPRIWKVKADLNCQWQRRNTAKSTTKGSP